MLVVGLNSSRKVRGVENEGVAFPIAHQFLQNFKGKDRVWNHGHPSGAARFRWNE